VATGWGGHEVLELHMHMLKQSVVSPVRDWGQKLKTNANPCGIVPAPPSEDFVVAASQ